MLTIEHLSYSYGRLMALSDVTVRADSGCVIAALGPNAAGKSTLLRCIIGALRPSAGGVSLGGRPAHRMKPRAIAQRLAYVPQRSVVSAAFTVRQVVELGRYALSADPRRVDAAIERLDLADVAERPYRALSVGQQQRVTLARVLAQISSDGVLVLDEPTSAMDLQHAAQTFRLLRELARGGATIIAAMHDLPAAAAIADEAWLLDRGRLVAGGVTCDVLAVERLRKVFGVGFAWLPDAAGRPRLLPDLPVEQT